MNTLKLRANTEEGTINRHVYGHFAEHLGRCIYEGIWVGEDSDIPNVRGIRTDVVEALKQLNIPNLRWPGGCFADIYHWRDGIGPRDQRTLSLNFWGNAPEPNEFGTHEFMDLCEQLDCDPYFGGNVGSGTVQEMRDWVEYLTANYDSTLSRLRRQNGREEAWPMPFWGIGNENWGCGGHMTAQQYADLYCQYHTHVKNYGETPMMKIASGLGGSDIEGEDVAIFMESTMKRRHPVKTDGVSIHYYVFLPNKSEHSATDFDEEKWFEVVHGAYAIGDVIAKNAAVLDEYDPEKRIWLIVDEWGAWYPVEPDTNPAFLYQQNSMRDAIVAGLTLHLFHDYCDRVQMANIAQTVNVLQAMVLTDQEKMILTPTYHVFEMFKGHQDATKLALDIDVETYSQGEETLPTVSASASKSASGEILLTLCNMHPTKAFTLDCAIEEMSVSNVNGRILVDDDFRAHNTFENPNRVQPQAYNGATLNGSNLSIELPAASVVAITLS